MTPTETLKHEHQVILMVLDAAEREAALIRNTAKVRTERIDKMLDFFRGFADRCHHAKEEDLLFTAMEKRGMAREGGPIAVMLMEHKEGRARLKTIADALPPAREGDAQAVQLVREPLAAYVQLLRAHIDKEDSILYPMADRLFSPEDQRQLERAFDKLEAEEMGEGVHEKYHHLAHDLAEG